MAKINVVFNDSSNQQGQGETTTQQNIPNNQNKTTSFAVGQAVIQLGKRALSYSSSLVGNITGDYILQSKIDNTIAVMGYASQIGVGFAAGGVAGGVASAIAVAGQLAMTGINYEIEKSKSNTQAQFLAQMQGGILNNGSR